MKTPSRWLWPLALCTLFAGRLLFGLSEKFFTEDETQIYLMGLRYHATGEWPYFGPDVVWTSSEIPGALQPLLVGGPLFLLPIPEAPIVLMNLLSFGALAALAWYICRRLPTLPRWLVWGWICTVPWTLQFSTHVINPSYVLPAAIVFFLGFFETLPALRLGVLSPRTAFFMMGAAVTWILQIHMSWPLLLPYVAVAWWKQRSGGARTLASCALAWVTGAAVPGLVLLPTLLEYGLFGGSGGTWRNIRLNPLGLQHAVIALARLFSFASLEINRFVATDDAKRLLFVWRHLWLAPVVAVVWLAGLIQPVWMLVSMVRAPRTSREWAALRALVAGSVVVVYLSYWFVMEPPQAHAIYALAPVAFLCAAYCWSLVDTPRWRTVAATVLAANICFHASLAAIQATTVSLYTNRDVVAQAIRLREPEILGHRRAFAVQPGPLTLRDPERPYDARHDLELTDASVTIGVGHTANWSFTLKNTNHRVAFRDVLYLTKYVDENGRALDERHEFLRTVFQPDEVRHIEVNDGFVTFPFANATLVVAEADALLPAAGR